MPERIVVLDAIGETVATKLRALLPDGFTLSHATERDDQHLAAIIAEADYAVSGQVAVNADVLRAATRLKLLHKWGVGVDRWPRRLWGIGTNVARLLVSSRTSSRASSGARSTRRRWTSMRSSRFPPTAR